MSELNIKCGKYNLPICKRLFDIFAAGILLALLLPLLVLIVLLIVLESKGGAIYRADRIGQNGKNFILFKFRSMYLNADHNIFQFDDLNAYCSTDVPGGRRPVFIKLRNDPRVTNVGRFLRQTSLDELPQLFNILKGEMSLVGNRPLAVYEASVLVSLGHQKRFQAPSGLTGLWQVSRRGKSKMCENERIRLDNFYAKKQSVCLDVKILIKTFASVFQCYHE